MGSVVFSISFADLPKLDPLEMEVADARSTLVA